MKEKKKLNPFMGYLKNNIFESIVLIISFIFIGWLGWINLKYNSSFLKVNVSSLFTAVIAIIVAYVLNQKKSDERMKKDQILKLLIKIQTSLNNEYVVLIKCDNSKKLNSIFQRSFDNRLNILLDLDSNFFDPDSLKYIKENFDKYRNDIGENVHDFDKLISLEASLSKYINNIDYKIDTILLNMY